MIGITLVTSGEEITNAMISNDVLSIYWKSLVYCSYKNTILFKIYE